MADRTEEQFSQESEGGVAVAEKPRSIGSDLTIEQIAERARSLGISADLYDED